MKTKSLFKVFFGWYLIYTYFVTALFIWDYLIQPNVVDDYNNIKKTSFTTRYVESEFLAFPAAVQQEKCYVKGSSQIRAKRLEDNIKQKSGINNNAYEQLSDKDKEYLKKKFEIIDALTFTEADTLKTKCSKEKDFYFKEKKINLLRLTLLLFMPLLFLGAHFLLCKINESKQIL